MSGEGFGQPNITNIMEFDVLNLKVLEAPTIIPGDVMNIVDVNEPITLELTFDLNGMGFGGWKVLGNRARVEFRAESMGGGNEFSIGTEYKALTDPTPYVVKHNHTFNSDRIYRIGAIITLENVEQGKETEPHAPVLKYHKGALGFYEGCLLQVNPHEE